MSITEHDFVPQEPSAGAGAATLPSRPPLGPRSAATERTERTLAQIQGIHGYARAMAFLTELDSQTWVARYTAAERLGDPGAVASPAAYAAWLRRVGAAWATVPMPTVAQATAHWPFTSLSPVALDCAGQIDADLRELSLTSGGPSSGAERSADRGAMTARGAALASLAAHEDMDEAYIAGAAYAAVATAQEVAVLTADVEHLSTSSARTPLPQHYVRHCTQLAAVRSMLRRELAQWSETAGHDAAERVVLAARMLCEHQSSALIGESRSGW